MAGDPNQAENVVAFKKKASRGKIGAPKPDPEEDRRRARANVMALIFAAILVAIGWLLVRKLGAESRMQDCLMSGRSNCAPITAPSRDD